MDPIQPSSTALYSPQKVKPTQASSVPRHTPEKDKALTQVSHNKVTLSKEGKDLLEALKQIDKESKSKDADKSVGDEVESFTYGALGMEHPDKLKEEKDSSYNAGQYLSAAATVGTLLLLIV